MSTYALISHRDISGANHDRGQVWAVFDPNWP
jgi:hypothetical protein